MLQAAAAGQGLCLARQSIAFDDLQSGRLVRPFSAFIESPFAYYFICRREKLESPSIKQFRQWIKAEIAAFPVLN